jgi:SAM-dependent methyltransferase
MKRRSSVLSMSHAVHQLSTRTKWDRRYLALDPAARREATPFMRFCIPQLPANGYALDLAAGAGRHSILMARHGLKVDAVDISPAGLRLAHRRSDEAGVAENIIKIVANVERGWMPHRQYDVILVSFFLCRPLFSLMKSRLRPGGWIVYETFTVKQLSQFYYRGSGRRDFYLEPGELRSAFSDFVIHFYDEGNHEDRLTAQLLAQKPGEVVR